MDRLLVVWCVGVCVVCLFDQVRVVKAERYVKYKRHKKGLECPERASSPSWFSEEVCQARRFHADRSDVSLGDLIASAAEPPGDVISL